MKLVCNFLCACGTFLYMFVNISVVLLKPETFFLPSATSASNHSFTKSVQCPEMHIFSVWLTVPQSPNLYILCVLGTLIPSSVYEEYSEYVCVD